MGPKKKETPGVPIYPGEEYPYARASKLLDSPKRMCRCFGCLGCRCCCRCCSLNCCVAFWAVLSIILHIKGFIIIDPESDERYETYFIMTRVTHGIGLLLTIVILMVCCGCLKMGKPGLPTILMFLACILGVLLGMLGLLIALEALLAFLVIMAAKGEGGRGSEKLEKDNEPELMTIIEGFLCFIHIFIYMYLAAEMKIVAEDIKYVNEKKGREE